MRCLLLDPSLQLIQLLTPNSDISFDKNVSIGLPTLNDIFYILDGRYAPSGFGLGDRLGYASCRRE